VHDAARSISRLQSSQIAMPGAWRRCDTQAGATP
jgi:hypothetical protein